MERRCMEKHPKRNRMILVMVMVLWLAGGSPFILSFPAALLVPAGTRLTSAGWQDDTDHQNCLRIYKNHPDKRGNRYLLPAVDGSFYSIRTIFTLIPIAHSIQAMCVVREEHYFNGKTVSTFSYLSSLIADLAFSFMVVIAGFFLGYRYDLMRAPV